MAKGELGRHDMVEAWELCSNRVELPAVATIVNNQGSTYTLTVTAATIDQTGAVILTGHDGTHTPPAGDTRPHPGPLRLTNPFGLIGITDPPKEPTP